MEQNSPQHEPAKVQPIVLDYAPAPLGLKVRMRLAGRICLLLGAVCCILGWLAIVMIHVETVVLSGPILLVIGIILLIAGALTHSPWSLIVGTAHCSICCLFVGLVNLLGWSPGDAQMPFTVMGASYTVLILIPSLMAWEQLSSGKG